MGGGSFPMAAVILWDRTSTTAATFSPILALCSGLITWMVTTEVRSGTINVTTLGDAYNSLAGDCVALGIGLVSVIILTFLFPEKRPLQIQIITSESPSEESGAVVDQQRYDLDEEKKEPLPTVIPGSETAGYNDDAIMGHFTRSRQEPVIPVSSLSPEEIRSQRIFAVSAFTIGVLGFLILLPFTLYGTGYTFSLGFFEAYVVIAFIWIWASATICVVLPLWESRHVLMNVVQAMFKDARKILR